LRHIEIELGGARFRARLLAERAPRTCEALWRALPLGGQATHGIWSGNMVHAVDAAPIEAGAVENGVGFQYPGLVVYYPPRREIAICYGDARFRDAATALAVTPLAEIEGDLAALAETAARLQFAGAAPIRLQRADMPAPAAGAASALGLQSGMAAGGPARPPASQIEINLDGQVVTATLLEEQAPRTCAALKRLLPIEGRALNTKWSGEMLHFWSDQAAPGTRGSVGLQVEPLESPTHFHWPGLLYYYPEWNGIRIPYGDAQMSGAFRVCDMTAFARFDGDWSSFRETARRLVITGARPMQLTLRTPGA